jgi:Zn-finger nucleic acid-binding protein
MDSKRVGETTIDECPKCRGIWFDPGEIDEIKNLVEPELRWMDFQLWREKAVFQTEYDPFFCPRCPDVALTAIAEKDTELLIRFCTQCGGSWLNAGTLANIIHSLNTEAESRTAADYFKKSLKQAAELFTGEKKLISEWKDLKAVLHLLKYRVFAENPKLTAVMKGLQKTLPL